MSVQVDHRQVVEDLGRRSLDAAGAADAFAQQVVLRPLHGGDGRGAVALELVQELRHHDPSHSRMRRDSTSGCSRWTKCPAPGTTSKRNSDEKNFASSSELPNSAASFSPITTSVGTPSGSESIRWASSGCVIGNW